MTYAWREQYLDVNLTTGKLLVKPISRELLIQTIGGVGLAAQMVYDQVPPSANPLSPENVLVFAAGPLSGTTWAGTGRLVIAGKSPLTGIWGEASMGGYFATQLKRCGYDAILLRGSSPEAVVLVLQIDHAELIPASELWGMETYQTEDALLTQYSGSEVISIGPAGERLVPMSALVHHKGNDIAARCGLGAVAGSKRLKAIVARGTIDLPVADPSTFKQLKREAINLFNQHDFIQVIQRGGGTASATPIAIDMADMTARNWDLAAKDWGDESAQKITGPAMQTQFPAKKDTCYACPVGCKWDVDAPRIDGSEGYLAGPEYETITGLGSQVEVDDPLSVIQAGDLCNRLGLDTISTGSTIAWALEVNEKGLLPEKYLDEDLDLKWGDSGLVLELVRRIGNNQPGLGALLAQGTQRAAEIIGAGSEITIQVKGLELPFHHPRALRGLEIAYATLPRGATHNEEGVSWDFEDTTYEDWVGASIESMNLSGASNSMVYCQFLAGALNADYTARLLTAVTGVNYSPEDLTRAGERSWYLRRVFNLRLGVGLEEDTLPTRIIRQIEESHASLKDFEQALREFHKQRQLDKRGVPSAQKLSHLGLEYLIDELDAK
jgi:aldehyde:ferredoxin oxidoreductase